MRIRFIKILILLLTGIALLASCGKDLDGGGIGSVGDPSFTGATVVDVQAFGADPTGVGDSTTAIQSALNAGKANIFFPDGTYKFTTLIVPAGVSLEGNNTTSVILTTSTIGNAITLNGHNITFKDFTLQQSGSVQGNGIVAMDKYWFSTENLHVKGFVNNFYISKAIYHTHTRLLSDYTTNGVNYYGAAGVWNSDWYNNVITFDTCRFGTNFTATGLSVKGAEVVLINPDFSDSGNANTIGAKIYGESASYPAHGIEIISPYVELTQTPFWFKYARVEIDGGFVQGGSSPGAAYPQMLMADNSTVYWRGNPRAQDYWTNICTLTNNSTLSFDAGFSGDPVTGNASVDSTSIIYYEANYKEGTFTGTLSGFSTNPTLTISYVLNGKEASIFIPATTGTSNATSMTLTGLPSWLYSTTGGYGFVRVLDNGVNSIGLFTVSNDGIVTFYKDVSGTGFTASGTKGFSTNVSITFTLY